MPFPVVGHSLNDRLCIMTPPPQHPPFMIDHSGQLLEQGALQSIEGAMSPDPVVLPTTNADPGPALEREERLLGIPRHEAQVGMGSSVSHTASSVVIPDSGLDQDVEEIAIQSSYSWHIPSGSPRSMALSTPYGARDTFWHGMSPWRYNISRPISLPGGGPLMFETPNTPSGADTLAKDFQVMLAKFIGSIHDKQVGDLAPSLTDKLQDLIPEMYNGEIKDQIQTLLYSYQKQPLRQIFELAAYLFSNNLLTNHQMCVFVNWVIDDNHLPSLRRFLQLDTPTVQAFSSELLKAGVRAKKIDFTRQILAATRASLNDIAEEAIATTNFEFQGFILSTLDPQFLSGQSGARLLRVVVRTRNVAAATTLINNNAAVDIQLSPEIDTTALWEAVSTYNLEMVECLVLAGADVDAPSWRRHQTPLALAVSRKNMAIAEYLVEHKAKIPAIWGLTGRPFLEHTATHAPEIHDMILRKIPTLRQSKHLSTKDIVSAAQYSPDKLSEFLIKNNHISSELLEESLVIALRSRNTTAVVNLLRQGVDPNGSCLSSTFERPIVAAVRASVKYRGHYTNLLISANVDVNVSGILEVLLENEDNPYDSHLLDSLTRAGYDLGKYGPPLLERSAVEQATAFIALLLDHETPINNYGRTRTVLQAAASQGTLQLVRYLVDRGANVDSPAYPIKGFTALQGAAQSTTSSVEKIEFLISIGAEVNDPPAISGGMTALEATVRPWPPLDEFDNEYYEEQEEYYEKKSDISKAFNLHLDKGATLNRPDGSPSPLLHDIIIREEYDVLKLALEKGAYPHHMWATEAAAYNDRTPLQLAAELSQMRSVELLLQHGANPNAGPGAHHGRTALQAAASAEVPNSRMITLLLSKGADVNAAPAIVGGVTALQGAAIKGYINIALLLIKEGADVNAPPALENGRTAIDGAAEHGRLDMVKMLLNARAVGDVLGKTGLTNAIKLAKKNQHHTVAALLEARGHNPGGGPE
ncbi:hypothetical protein EIK77_004118 [Talaromyces pinophilus]|nr:hypothetical protein EIK77_004118 [Talaromyces pinophilus]